MTTMAPRLLTPADLLDPQKYTRSTLPVFGKHERLWVDGEGKEVLIAVAEEDFPAICAATNKPWSETWTPARITTGHIKQGKGVDEGTQPRVVGYAVNFHVAELNGQPWTWADLYQRTSEGVPVAQYPFRSSEYDPITKRISGIALLTQDPFIDQGAVHYQAVRNLAVHYLRETKMEPTADEEAQYKKFCSYMKRAYPKLSLYMDDPSSTNVSVPAAKPEQAQYSKAPEYTALEQDNLRLSIERDLDSLAYQGVGFDRALELPKLVAMTPEQRTQHVAYMKSNYRRVPVAQGGGYLPVVGSDKLKPADGKDEEPKKLTAEQVREVLAYQKAHNVTYEIALTRYTTR